MAGTSQASNLSGMLNSIAGTIGEMGGAGHQFVDSFRASQAPSVNQNDPASMRAYADWAMRNGDKETAQRYQIAASKMEQEQGARRAAVDAQGFQQSIRKLEEARASAINNAGGDKEAIAKRTDSTTRLSTPCQESSTTCRRSTVWTLPAPGRCRASGISRWSSLSLSRR